jgi:hypothetical protein
MKNKAVNSSAKKIIKERNKTTNYPKDSHGEFCKRCFAEHKGCPRGTKHGCDL